jgi:hypothetical protein
VFLHSREILPACEFDPKIRQVATPSHASSETYLREFVLYKADISDRVGSRRRTTEHGFRKPTSNPECGSLRYLAALCFGTTRRPVFCSKVDLGEIELWPFYCSVWKQDDQLDTEH